MRFLNRALLAAALTLVPSLALALPAAAATSGPHISIAGVSLKEDDRQALFKVTVTGVHGDVTVNYATRDGSAIAGKDYSATSGPVTIKAADSEALIVVKVVADTILEPAENFYVDLSNTITATIDVGTAEGIIKNDDPLPTVSVGNAQVTEAEDVNKAVMAVFPVYLSNAASQPVSVDFATADYCATGWPLGRASGLCSEQRGTVQFAAEDNTTQVIKVPVWGDRTHELDQQFKLNLSNALHARIGRAQAIGTVHDNDPVPTIDAHDVVVAEGNSGITKAYVPFTLSNPTTVDVWFGYWVSHGSAWEDEDYTWDIGPYSAMAVIRAGTTSTSIEIDVIGDTIYEPDEDVHINVDSVYTLGTAVLGDTHATLTITTEEY